MKTKQTRDSNPLCT